MWKSPAFESAFLAICGGVIICNAMGSWWIARVFEDGDSEEIPLSCIVGPMKYGRVWAEDNGQRTKGNSRTSIPIPAIILAFDVKQVLPPDLH